MTYTEKLCPSEFITNAINSTKTLKWLDYAQNGDSITVHKHHNNSANIIYATKISIYKSFWCLKHNQFPISLCIVWFYTMLVLRNYMYWIFGRHIQTARTTNRKAHDVRSPVSRLHLAIRIIDAIIIH